MDPHDRRERNNLAIIVISLIVLLVIAYFVNGGTASMPTVPVFPWHSTAAPATQPVAVFSSTAAPQNEYQSSDATKTPVPTTGAVNQKTNPLIIAPLGINPPVTPGTSVPYTPQQSPTQPALGFLGVTGPLPIAPQPGTTTTTGVSQYTNVIVPEDASNPCDPSSDPSITTGNLVTDPYFSSAFSALPFNPNNPQDDSYDNLPAGSWYATQQAGVSVTGKTMIPDNSASSLLPLASVSANTPTKGAVEILPSVDAPAYIMQKISLTPAELNKQYEFRVCVFGDSDLTPTASVSGSGLAITTAAGGYQSKTSSYLGTDMVLPASIDPTRSVRSQNEYWTLYRFLFSAKAPADNSNPYLVVTLSGWKNQYGAAYPAQWFMRPVITPATAASLMYVPPLSAFGGHITGAGTPAPATDTNSDTENSGQTNATTTTNATSNSTTTTTAASTVGLTNGNFSQGLSGWDVGQASLGQSITAASSSAVFTHGSGDDAYTMVIGQAIDQTLVAHTAYQVSATFSGNATAYFGFGNHVPSDATMTGGLTYDGKGQTTLNAIFTPGASDIPAGVIYFTISSYKQQPGTTLTVSNVHFDGPAVTTTTQNTAQTTTQQTTTTTTVAASSNWPVMTPVPELTGFVDNFGAYASGTSLDKNRWLLMNKGWGGDNNGVAGANVSFHDLTTGLSLPALRLYSFGGVDRNGGLLAGHVERQGAAIVTNNYYASGSYFVCAKLPTHTGVVSAFWPFHYIDYSQDQPGFWQEPNPIRNSEIDWEMPTSDLANTLAPGYGEARANNWGGQLGGEGGNDTQRVVFPTAVNDGRFHEFGIVWYTGRDNSDGTRTPGYIKWTYADTCTTNPTLSNPAAIAQGSGYTVVQEADGASVGQDNIPYRAARFTIGSWFPVSDSSSCSMSGVCTSGYSAGGKFYMGWGGTPNFTQDSMDLSWVAIYPGKSILPSGVTNMYSGSVVAGSQPADKGISDARDYWTPETVPNAGNWTGLPGAPSDSYPVK